jgi:hypothetical protein
MFTLRRISEEGVQMNRIIGDSYTYIDREINPEEFNESFKNYFERNHVADLDETSDNDTKRVYAFVCNSSYVQPLYKNQTNYIMTENGKTFANVSYR